MRPPRMALDAEEEEEGEELPEGWYDFLTDRAFDENDGLAVRELDSGPRTNAIPEAHFCTKTLLDFQRARVPEAVPSR